MAGKSKDYYEELREGVASLHMEMEGIVRNENPDVVLVTSQYQQNVGGSGIYHVLDATVFVDDHNPPGKNVHTFFARTDEQIEEAKSKLEELTRFKLTEVNVLSGVQI